MKKRTSFSHSTKETAKAHQHHGEQESSLPLQKKQRRTTAAGRILRDMLNLPPLRDRGSCWPTAMPRK